MTRVQSESSAGRATRGDTRLRILETALVMFAEKGYAGTSVRDIAEQLDITKAAVHYHFSAKEQMVAALLEPMLLQFEEVLDRQAAAPPDPRALLLGVRDVLVASGPLLSILGNDPSVNGPSPDLHARVEALTVRAAEVLAGPGATAARVLRGHCALGGFLAGWQTCCRGILGVPSVELDDVELDVVLTAALGALGKD